MRPALERTLPAKHKPSLPPKGYVCLPSALVNASHWRQWQWGHGDSLVCFMPMTFGAWDGNGDLRAEHPSTARLKCRHVMVLCGGHFLGVNGELLAAHTQASVKCPGRLPTQLLMFVESPCERTSSALSKSASGKGPSFLWVPPVCLVVFMCCDKWSQDCHCTPSVNQQGLPKRVFLLPVSGSRTLCC